MLKSLHKFIIITLLSLVALSGFSQDQCKVVGWATQNGGVTGGGSASATIVSNYAAFKSAVESSSIKVIHVSGTITFPSSGRISFQDQSNKSILGLPGAKIVSADQTKDGSGVMYVKRCSNIIMRNLIFEGPGAYDTDGWDLLAFDACTNMWVDHCEFHDGVDGNFDIKNASDLISVTWCTFSYEKAPKAGGPGGSDDHRYSNLFGSSDGATGDDGKLRITMQYCWWGEGCKERMPRIRYGKVHMVNNYFSSTVANQGIRAGFKADILAEGNFFISGYKLPVDEFNKDYTAILSRNNSGASNLTKNTAFTPPYTLTIANAADIVTPIKNCAGAKLTSVNGCTSCGGSTPVNKLPTVSITSPTNNQQITGVPASVTINATAADSDGSISKVEFYNGTTLLGSDNSSPYSYTWTNVAAGTYSITAKATDNSNGVTTSTAVSVVVKAVVNGNQLPSVTITSPTNNQQYTSAPASITINANATDSDGTISKVEFYNGTTLLNSDNSSPYSYTWTNVAVGNYELTAKAYDNSNAVTTSSIVVVKVSSSNIVFGESTLSKKGSGSSTQTLDQYTEITAFYYQWTEASTVTVTGLPQGVNYVIDVPNSRVDISGTPTEFGVFDYAVTTVGGNPNTSKSGTLTVSKITGLDDNQLNRVAMYPNPANTNVTLSESTDWTLLNASGETISSGQGTVIDLNNQSSGLYFVKVGERVERLVKQ
jgi:pectate lyase